MFLQLCLCQNKRAETDSQKLMKNIHVCLSKRHLREGGGGCRWWRLVGVHGYDGVGVCGEWRLLVEVGGGVLDVTVGKVVCDGGKDVRKGGLGGLSMVVREI